jgi:DNA-binding NarL/FixJ family response regulator
MAGFEGIYRSAASPKRQAEVLERLRAGMGEKKISADLGISRHAIHEIVDTLRAEGRLPAGRPGGA